MVETQALERVEILEGEVVNPPLTDELRAEHTIRVERININFQVISGKSLEIWNDLKWIRDNRTYLERHNNFPDFCRDELGKDNSQIYRYIKDAEFKEQLLLEAKNDEERASILNLKESNTRYLRTLPPDAQIPLWRLAYTLGQGSLSKKDDGSVEMTTAFLESVGERVGEALDQGGIHIDGEFIGFDAVSSAAQAGGVDPDTAKELLLAAGVSEEYFERLKRQEQHIRDKSQKNDVVTCKGTIEVRQDVNGSDYPVLIDVKGNETDMAELILAFNNRFVNISLRAPIRD